MRSRSLYLAFLSVSFVCLGADTGSEEEDVRTLQAARIQPDGPSAVRYFRLRAVGTADNEEMPALIRKLGDEAYTVRERAVEELISRGVPAIGPLRIAKSNPDVEIARRAERCLKAIESVPAATLSAAAARMIARHNPEGGAEAILAFLPFADDETVADEIRNTLAAIATKDGRPNPALLQGLDHADAIHRSAVGEALIRSGVQDARRLFSDRDPDVRLRVTLAAVANLKDKSVMPNLINLLADGPPGKLWRVEDILLRLAGDAAPRVSLGRDDAGRKKCRDAWSEWWTANAEKVDLAKLDHVPQLLGLTMILQTDSDTNIGRVFEVNAKKEVQWSISDLKTPQDAIVVGADRVLIAEAGDPTKVRRGNEGKVTLRDFSGKEIWEKPVANPMCVQALPHGHVLIATRRQLIELDENQKEVFTFDRSNDINYAAKDRNGDYVILTTSQIIRLKPDKTQQAISIPHNGRLATLSLSPNGRVIITKQSGVAEYDTDGSLVWSTATPAIPMSAERLPHGNILVTSYSDRSVIEMDRQNKVVWKYKPSDQKAGDNSYPQRARRR